MSIEAKRAAQARYQLTAKGKETRRRYEESPKGRETKYRYAISPKGMETRECNRPLTGDERRPLEL